MEAKNLSDILQAKIEDNVFLVQYNSTENISIEFNDSINNSLEKNIIQQDDPFNQG